MLLGEDCKQELQRKYEKIMLDEHITNLYAPRWEFNTAVIFISSRIIAQKTTAEVESTKTLSFGDTRKSFKHGVRSSNWANFKKRALEVFSPTTPCLIFFPRTQDTPSGPS